MSLSTETKYYPAVLTENWWAYYSKLENVEPKAPSYSRKKRPRHFKLQTIKWHQKSMANFFNINNQRIDTTWWKRTDHKELNWVHYYMRIKWWEVSVFRTCDFCTYKEIFKDCACTANSNTACWNKSIAPHNKFINRYWPVGKPKLLWKDCTTNVPVVWIYQQTSGVQLNKIAPNEWRFYDNQLSWNFCFNYANWSDSIQPWDVLYVYNTTDTAICWQRNRISYLDKYAWSPWHNGEFVMEWWWVWFSWWILSPSAFSVTPTLQDYYKQYWTYYWAIDNSLYSVLPQTIWEWASYMIFPDVWEWIGVMTCSWMKVIHYSDDSATHITWNCNFNKCFSYNTNYDWLNGTSYQLFLDPEKNVIQYSFPWQQWLFWDYIPVRPWAISLSTHQNFAVYFWKDYIWAFYIDTWTTTSGTTIPKAQWNIVRNNLWIWENSNGRWDSYTQYDNSFYFFGSDKRLRALTLARDNSWQIISKVDDMTDDAFAIDIIGDLDNVKYNDDVYLSADDDRLIITINSSDTNSGSHHKTKELIYHKRYKIWTQNTHCCSVLTKRLTIDTWKWVKKQILWDELYIECWNNTPCWKVKWLIELYVWEDGNPTNTTSFNIKSFDFIKTKRYTPFNWSINAYATRYKNWVKYQKQFTWIWNKDWFDNVKAIQSNKDTLPSECMKQQLKEGEWFKIKSLNNLFDIVVDCWEDCEWSCQERIIDDYCFEYNDGMHYLSEYTEYVLNMKNAEGEMLHLSYELEGEVSFWWCIVWYRDRWIEDWVTECQKISADCLNDIVAVDTTKKCL